MSYLYDDDDVPFFFELEVDDEISFKAPQMATKKTVPVKRIETSRSSFAMPQFSVRNLVTSSELFKSTEADSFFDKENNPKSTQSCNTAEKPKLPPSSAEKLMRYSVDSAVSFIENFSSMIPRDLPSFSTIAEGADESVEDPNAEDCDLSEAEISEYRCAGRMRGGKFTESEFNFQLGSTNNKDDNDIDGLASLIGSASNDNSIDCRHDVPTKKNINTNSNKDDDCNEDEEDACEDKSFKSESCESYDTASEDAAAIKQKGINTDKIVLPTTNKTTNQDQEKMSAGEEAVKGAEDGVHGDDVGDVAGDKSAVCAVNNGNHVPTPTPTAVAVTAAAVIPTAIITTTATTTPNEDKLADKDTHASTNKDICVENIDVDNCTTTPAPKHAPAPAAPSVSALIPAIPALAPISAAVVAPSAAALSAVAPLVTVPPVIASPGVPVPSRRMSMIKTLGERKNIPRGEEVEEVVKEDTNTTIKPQEKAEVVAGREGGVVEVEVTTAAEATTDNINQIIDVKKEEVVVKKVQKIEDKVQVKLGVELITDLKSEKMASATAKQNLSDEKNTKNTENIEKADVVVTGEVAEHALLPSKVVTFQETPILIEGEGEDGEGKSSDVCSCDTTICLAMNPYVHLVEGGAEVMDGVARSTQKIKEIIDGVARSSYKIKQKDAIASMILEEDIHGAENSSDSTWVSTESATGVKEFVKEVVDEVVADVENEKKGEKEEVEEKEVVKEKQIEKEEGEKKEVEVEKRRYSVQEAVKEVEKGIKSDRRRSSIAPSTQHLSNKNTNSEMKTGTKVDIEMEKKMEEGRKDKAATGSVREIYIKETEVDIEMEKKTEEVMKDKASTGSVREIHIKEEVVKEVEVVQNVMEGSNADGLTDEEREELAALIAEEESILAEIEMAENERLTEEGNEETKDQASVENHVEVKVESRVEVDIKNGVEVEVEVQPVLIEICVQESEVQSLEIDKEGIVVEKNMVTKKTEADKEKVGKVENEGLEVQIEEREEERTIEKEKETVTQNNTASVPTQNSKSCSAAYENSNESVKSLTPVFARLSEPELKTEKVTNNLETNTEPIPLFAVVTKGYQMNKTGNDDEWNMNLLASSPLPTEYRRQSIKNNSNPKDTDFIRAAKMIEDEAEKERKFASTQVVDKVMDIEICDDKENIGMKNKFDNKNENQNKNNDKDENEEKNVDEIEEEKLMQRNLKRVSIIVNTISSLSPSPSSTGPGMSPMTGTITPTTMMTQERYTRSEVDVAVQMAVREAEIFFLEKEKERKDIEKFLLSRADAAEETVKALSEIMKEKDKEINMANDSASLSGTQSRALAHRLQTIEAEMDVLQKARTSEILSVKNFYAQSMESLRIKNEEEKVILIRELELKLLMKEESVKKQIKEHMIKEQEHAREIVSAVDAAKEKVYAKAKVQFEAGNKEFLRLKSLLKESKAECEGAVRLSDSLTIQLTDSRHTVEIETKKASDAVKRSNNLKSLLVSLIDSVQKLKSGTSGSTTVRDDQECEEAAVSNVKDIIKATSKEIIELSEGKSSLQASTTVLERTLQRMEGELIACKNAGEKNSDKVALSSALLAKTKIELQDVIKERDIQMTALATLLAKGDTGPSSSTGSAEVQELTERCTNLRKMNDELLGMLEKMYEEQAKK